MPVLNRIAAYSPEMTEWRRWLHRNPELGFELPKTARYVADKLREIGVDELHEGIAQTGMVAIIKGQSPGPTIGLRADMDALPIPEQTGAEHASETEGQMHACGHDGHTTMLLGAAKYLAETRKFAGSVALIFQPAEEGGGGGEVMVEEGIMDRFEIKQVYAVHTSPALPLGQAETCVGGLLASAAEFTIHIKGKGGHGAFPEETADPVAAALQIGQALNTIITRNLPSKDRTVISLTQIHTGTAFNVVPDTAMLNGTVRCLAREGQETVEGRMRDICSGIGAAMGVEVSLEYLSDIPVTFNDADATAFAVETASEILGAENVDGAATPHMGGEDFSFMLNARPGAFLLLGQGIGPFCHHPEFDFNDELSPIGASYFARLVERALPLT